MAVYYVLGACLVVWGLGLAIFGLLREDFPPSGGAVRPLIGVTVVLVVATITALLASTKKEHPREEAAAKAKETKAEAPAQAPSAGAKTVKVSEKEFSIALAGGTDLSPGRYTFAVQNTGKIEHDLAIEGDGIKETKTPLIAAGQGKDLTADLKPGTYTFFCSVPGHEQAGMKLKVTVGGGGAAAPPAKPAQKEKKAAGKPETAKTVDVAEKEFSIALAGGNSLDAGKYTFAVRNTGKIEHDLAIEGGGLNETKTKLIAAGQGADLAVDLKPGRYTFYCSVPGHEQAGMKVAVTVR